MALAAVQPQPTFSFMALVGKTAELPKTGRSKLTDPLSLAKTKVVEGLKAQKGYAQLVLDKQPIPKKGDRDVSLWFSKHTDGWWTTIRHGQRAVKFDGKPDLFIGKLEQMPAFYDAVIVSVEAGELDAQIAELQKREAKQTGSN